MNAISLKNTSRILSIVLFSGLLACSGPSKEEEESGTRKVKTAFSGIENVKQDMDFTGNVVPFEKNIISPSMQLRIQKIFVDVGDAVKKGQLLVQMDPAQLFQTEVQLNNLEKEYARLDTLYKTGSVSEQQLDQMKTELDVLRTNYQNLKENTRLLSPINGVVTERNFEDGDMYNMAAGAGILTVMQIDPVQVDINVPERYFPAVVENMAVSMQLDVYPDTSFAGRVFLKHPTIDPATRTFTVETIFPNKEQLIRPGMFGRVNIVFETLERVTVPDLAVQRQQGTNDSYVFVVKDGKVTRKEVKLGRRVDDFYEVISGLDEGKEVVVEGHTGLLEGTPVEVIQ
ncbi:efflux RND transporter periplasmic adaptor subunit [Anaerophaga thermohalophila]|uniref:efflux RND transporter periplasmic adaptor subunit n=1 Tax=Anaerophaga thermohalophila TaxID=177400 RepID=UPI000237C89A|nr:efflux RND transporter periplasmic adaptor subunit [Anaerophaga thermohalophila]